MLPAGWISKFCGDKHGSALGMICDGVYSGGFGLVDFLWAFY